MICYNDLPQLSHMNAFTNIRQDNMTAFIGFRLIARMHRSFMRSDKRATVSSPIAATALFITDILCQFPRKCLLRFLEHMGWKRWFVCKCFMRYSTFVQKLNSQLCMEA